MKRDMARLGAYARDEASAAASFESEPSFISKLLLLCLARREMICMQRNTAQSFGSIESLVHPEAMMTRES
jgi:hypothetical protein